MLEFILENTDKIWQCGAALLVFYGGVKIINFLLGFLKDKLAHLDTDVDKVAETCDKISLSQEKIVNGQSKIVQSQGKIVKLIDSVDKRINGRI